MTLATPIRLAFCITELDPGGAERALTQLVLSLNRNEWEPHVICLGPRGHFADVLESGGVPVLCLNARGVFSLPIVLFRLTRELRRLRPALVQTFLFHANILGRIAARLAGVRLVVSGLRVAEHRSSWYGRIDRWTNSLVTMNVCVSQGVADFTESNVGIQRTRLVVIPNSVDVERFKAAAPADMTQFEIPAGSQVFISIGRLEQQKGIDLLIDAAALLNPLPEDVHFLIVGEGPESKPLREQVRQNNLSEHFHFANRRDDVPELLASSTALILPSRWEGMPNVVLEAMASGLPVIATRVEGIAELVKDHVTGLTISPEQPKELAAAIQWLLANPEFITRAAIESQHHISQNFTTESTTEKYVQIYRRLLSPV